MIQIRSCEGLGELQACVQLQIDTWGYDATDLIPRKLFLLAQRIGGQVIGAFDSDEATASNTAGALVGFAISLPGIKSWDEGPEPYLHSHMLAVRPSHQNRGLGAQLKWAQRDEALTRGIRRMEWTFDPLAIKNAFLNIHKLGAIVREYRVDFYGVSSSRLQGGLPTDRLLAEWELDSPRVAAPFARQSAVNYEIEERIVVPASINEWKSCKETRERALTVQFEIRRKFQKAFSKGLAVLDFSMDVDRNGIFELGRRLKPDSERGQDAN